MTGPGLRFSPSARRPHTGPASDTAAPAMGPDPAWRPARPPKPPGTIRPPLQRAGQRGNTASASPAHPSPRACGLPADHGRGRPVTGCRAAEHRSDGDHGQLARVMSGISGAGILADPPWHIDAVAGRSNDQHRRRRRGRGDFARRDRQQDPRGRSVGTEGAGARKAALRSTAIPLAWAGKAPGAPKGRRPDRSRHGHGRRMHGRARGRGFHKVRAQCSRAGRTHRFARFLSGAAVLPPRRARATCSGALPPQAGRSAGPEAARVRRRSGRPQATE